MSTLRNIYQRRIESKAEELDLTTNASSTSEPPDATDPLTTQNLPHLTGIGYLIIAALFLLLAFSLLLLVWTLWRRRQNHHRTNDDNEFPSDDSDITESTEKRIQRRYETIEHWIITKRVLPYSEISTSIQKMLLTSRPSKTDGPAQLDKVISSSMKNHDHSKPNATLECPICISDINLGQIVSWSSNVQCIHAYHHECIKEWLLRNTQCCLCKQTFLYIDTKNGKEKESLDVASLTRQYITAAALSFYSLPNGLIRIPETILSSRSQLQQLEEQLLSETVPSIDLIASRRNRIYNSNGQIQELEEHSQILEDTRNNESTASMDLAAPLECETEGIESDYLEQSYMLQENRCCI